MDLLQTKSQEETLKQTGNLKSGTEAEEKWDKEWRKCRRDVHYFLNEYAYIQDFNTGRRIKWESWDYLEDLLNIFLEYKDIIILKARQLGISWLLAGYGLWKVQFSESAKGLFLSQGEKESWDLVGKCKFVLLNEPPFLQLTQKHPESRELLDFKANYSLIESLPSTEKAGRSTDATFIARDEPARHPYGKPNFSAVGPTIDGGGQSIDLGTIDKQDLNNHLTERVNKAKIGAIRKDYPSGLVLFTGGESGATLVFAGWKLRPTRLMGLTLEEWFETKIKPKYDVWEIEQEYPATIEEALSAPVETCRFNVDALKEMLTECVSSIRVEYNGWVKIYKEPVAGRKYCFPIDPSEGTYDPSLGVIIDGQTNEEVAKYHGKIPIDDQARIIYDLYNRYGQPFIAPERNASGLTLIEKLKDMGITNFYFCDKAREKAGWWTSSANRGVMIQDLAENIRLRQYRIADEEEIRELQSFIRTEKHPDGIARGGCHDEAPIVWAIYSQIRKSMRIGEMRVTSWKYTD